MIKNVVFDIGKVLIDFRYKEYMRDLSFDESVIEKLSDDMVLSEDWDLLDRGEEEEVFINRIRKKLPEYKKEIDTFFKDYGNLVESYPYAKSWLEGLKKRGYGVYLLSNYPEKMFARHSSEKFTFMEYIDGKIVSGMVKLRKPEKEIYELLLNTYGLKADESVFIDDRKENVEAAENVGLKAIYFDEYEKVCDKLEKILAED